MRSATAAVLAALDSGVCHVVFLAEIRRKSGTDRFWTGRGTLSWSGQSWQEGMILDVADLEQNVNGDMTPTSLVLSMVEPAQKALMLAADEYPERIAVFYEGLLDTTTGGVIADPIAVHERRMRRGQFNSATQRLMLYLDHPLVDSLRSSRRTRSHADQLQWALARYGIANDEFFYNVTSAPRSRPQWPRKDWEALRGT